MELKFYSHLTGGWKHCGPVQWELEPQRSHLKAEREKQKYPGFSLSAPFQSASIPDWLNTVCSHLTEGSAQGSGKGGSEGNLTI